MKSSRNSCAGVGAVAHVSFTSSRLNPVILAFGLTQLYSLEGWRVVPASSCCPLEAVMSVGSQNSDPSIPSLHSAL